jgi:excisionase family DNA binding protein
MGYSHTEGATSALLTMDEVLGYLRVTSRTIYRLIKAGDLPAVRVGRQWRFRQSDLDAWLSRQQTNVN